MTPLPRVVDPGPPLDTPDSELELLALLSPADVEEAKADDNPSRLMALLLAAALLGTLYVWRPDRGVAGQFVHSGTGRVITAIAVRRELDRYLDVNGRQMRALALQLRNGNISLAQWELAMRRAIRNAHLNAIALQRGGWSQMTLADFQRAGAIIRDQFVYLKKFGLDIADGTQRMDGSLDWRANLYGQAPRNSFYQSLHANLPFEVTHVRSIRHARDSCRDCIALNGVWFVIGDPAYKLPGDRQCLHNCRCSESYGMMDGGAMVEVGTA